MSRKKIVTMMALGIIGFQGINTIEASASPTNTQDSINAQRSMIYSTESKLEEVEVEIEKAELEIQKLDDEIIILLEDIEKNEKLIEQKEEEIRLLEKEIKANKEKAEILYEKSKERLITFQQTQVTPTFAVIKTIINSDSIVELIERTANAKKIFDASNDLMNEYNIVVETLEKQERELKEVKVELTKEREKLEGKKKELEDKKNEAEKKSDELKKKKSKLKGDYTVQISELKELEELLERQKEQEEAERKAREEAERLAQEQAQNSIQTTSIDGNTFAMYMNSSTDVDASKASQVISEGYRYLGLPYIWGGTTPAGFDCSGFTKYIYRTAGVNLPRVARAQQNVGTQVSVYDVQPGDLIFLGNPAHHVGVYIGDGYYLHSPRTGDVIKVAKYNPSQWTSATRVL